MNKNLYTLGELIILLKARDLYLYNYYTTYKNSDIPLIEVEQFLERDHEYLLERKVGDSSNLYSETEVRSLLMSCWHKGASYIKKNGEDSVLNPMEMHNYIEEVLK